MCDDFKNKAHIVPEPPVAMPARAPAPASNYGRQFERLFPGMPCFYCGEAPNSVDHVVPRSRGGKDGKNLVPCCFRCNQMKGNQTIEEFVERMQRILRRLEEKKVLVDGKVIIQAGKDVIQAPVIQFTGPLVQPLAA